MPRFTRRSTLRLVGASISLAALSACVPLPEVLRRAAPVPLVAMWSNGAVSSSPPVMAFLDTLKSFGYAVGNNIALEWRLLDSRAVPNDVVAQELVALKPAAIVVSGTPTIVALAERTHSIPLISCLPHRSLVSLGLAASAAHPGSNVTGTEGKDDYYAKMVELLEATVPSLKRVAYLRNPATPGTDGPMAIAQAAAGVLGLEFVELQARNFDDIGAAFARADAIHAEGMVVATDTAFTSGGDAFPAADPLMALPLRYHLPVIYSNGDGFVASGGLMGFGVDLRDSYARAATYVDKILRGAAVGELPIEESMVFDVSLNMRTARALGISFPAEVLAQANLIIQ